MIRDVSVNGMEKLLPGILDESEEEEDV